MTILICIAIGLVGGIGGGLFGIGGGIIIVPAMIYLLAFSQHKAQGTSLLALLAPVGILGVMNYAKAGNIDWKVGGLIAVGFVGGTYLGSKISLSMDESTLRRGFAILLVAVALQLWFKKA